MSTTSVARHSSLSASDDRALVSVFAAYTVAATLWLLFVTAVGVLLAYKFGAPDFGRGAWLTFGRLRPIRTNATFYGWASLALVGAAYHVERTGRALRVAIIPMGYCYPGRGNGGDLPPRAECAQLWLEKLLAKMPLIELTLLIGQYAQRHFLGKKRKASLVETTKAWAQYAPRYIPLPHPSPRNTPWFAAQFWI